MGDRLRPLWDFDDLDASEQRFQAQLEREPTGEGQAEVLTQLARVHALRGHFDEGERILGEAEAIAGASPVALARINLERGRLRRSGGDLEAALPLFESAFAVALEAGEEFIAVDAAHMVALVAPGDGMLVWTQRGLELAASSSDPEVTYWLGPLLNNLGWTYYESGEYELALDAFEQALQARERTPERRAEIELARYGVGKTLRALGRPGEAAALLELAVAWTRAEGRPDGWFHEELAENYSALGREAEAREHAALALSLLADGDPSFGDDAERVARLRRLAGRR